MELYKKYRPKKLDEVAGQNVAVKLLESAFDKNKVPHAILFTGQSGTGKTTLARIVRRMLRCSKYDFIEIAPRKVDDIRLLKSRINQAPMKSACRVYFIDECHKLTSDAQDEFLKMLEDTPEHVYFLLATTESQKLKKTVRTRTTEIQLNPLKDDILFSLLESVCVGEDCKFSDEVLEKIVENSDGSARKALVFLDSIIHLETEQEQLDSIITQTSEKQAFEIVRCLLYKKSNWKEVAGILKSIENDEEPERLRRLILACCKTEILKAGKFSARAYQIIDSFRDNFFDSGFAGLVAACFEVVSGSD